MSIAKNSAKPSTGSDRFRVTPDNYIVEIHEIGLSNTNPIKGTTSTDKTWVKENNITLWKSKGVEKPLIIDVAPGKKMPKDLVLNQPPLGNYKYNYVLLNKRMKIKAKGEFNSGSGNKKFFSKNNKTGGEGNPTSDFSQFNEDILNFKFQTNWDNDSHYFKDAEFKTEGLLLKADKKTKSGGNNQTNYILAVYDCSDNPMVVNQNGGLNFNFSTTNRVEMGSEDWSNLSSNPVIFSSLPPRYVTEQIKN